MKFDDFKNRTLWKMKYNDKSSKKSLDKEIVSLCNYINSLEDYVTTSSCSGRITLIKQEKEKYKTKRAWIFKSHDPISFNDIANVKLPNELVFFKMESAILHIACRNLSAAIKMLNIARYAGFKRSGIISIKDEKIMIEVLSTENLEFPFSLNKKRLINDDYLNVCIKIANERLKRTREKLKKFELKIKEEFNLL